MIKPRLLLMTGVLCLLLAEPARGGGVLSYEGKPLAVPGGSLTLHLEPESTAPAGALAVLRRAASLWSNEKVKVSVEPGSGAHRVTFADAELYDSGICQRETHVACTVLNFDAATGEILAARIAFNPYKRHAVDGAPGAHDLTLVALHEIGHALGLDHSRVAGAVMHAEVEFAGADPGGRSGFRAHRLARDDERTLALIYDAEAARWEGVASRAAAHVFAMDAGGRVEQGTGADADGRFVLAVASDGLRVVEEPESPVISTVGVIESGLYVGAGRLTLARGREYTLALTRAAFDGPESLTLPAPGVLAVSEAIASPALLRRRIRIAADAPAGSYTLIYKAGEGEAFLPGGIEIVPNPVVDWAAVIDGRLIVAGRDLASGEEASETGLRQLGGVSVSLNGRYLPLLRVGPNEIAADPPPLPEGIAGLEVRVVTGAGVESEPVAVQ